MSLLWRKILPERSLQTRNPNLPRQSTTSPRYCLCSGFVSSSLTSPSGAGLGGTTLALGWKLLFFLTGVEVTLSSLSLGDRDRFLSPLLVTGLQLLVFGQWRNSSTWLFHVEAPRDPETGLYPGGGTLGTRTWGLMYLYLGCWVMGTDGGTMVESWTWTMLPSGPGRGTITVWPGPGAVSEATGAEAGGGFSRWWSLWLEEYFVVLGVSLSLV